MLVKKDKDIILSYLEDYSNLQGGYAESVFLPETEQDIVSVLRHASLEKTPITVSGAGTGVTGARIAFGGAVLSMEKMNKIISIENIKDEKFSGKAIVEPGVILNDFLEEIDKNNFFYPPDPTEKSSFLGGNVATGASGARTFKFGTTRDFVLRLRVILSTGSIIDIKRNQIHSDDKGEMVIPFVDGGQLLVKIPAYDMPSTKNSAGYYSKKNMDAVDLFIGHDGTLGVITEIELGLLKKPYGIFDCYVFFNKDEDCLAFINEAKQISLNNRKNNIHSVEAMSLEYFDKNTLELLRGKYPEIPKNANAACFFEQITEKDNEDDLMLKWSGLIEKHKADLNDSWFGQTKKERARFHNFRHDVPDSVNELIKKKSLYKIGTDIAVPEGRLAEMISFYRSVLTENNLRFLIFGHIGNNHLHVNVLPKNQLEHQKATQLYAEFAKKAIKLHGTITAEHGIGKIKHFYLELMYAERGIKEMVRIKKLLDPACILGQDNIFPKKLILK